MRDTPDWSLLPAETPLPIRALLRRCLEKDPRKRLRDIGDARFEFEADGRGSPVHQTARPVMTIVAATAVIVAVIGFAGGYFARAGLSRPPAIETLTTHNAPTNEASHSWPDVLPDGDHVLYTIEYVGKPFDEADIAVVSLSSGANKIVLKGGAFAAAACTWPCHAPARWPIRPARSTGRSGTCQSRRHSTTKP